MLKLGLKPGDRVAVQTGTGIGHYLSLFALMKAGMAIAPIDRSFMPEEIAYQLEDSGARGFIVDSDIYREKIEAIRPGFDQLEYYITIGGNLPSGYGFETLVAEGALRGTWYRCPGRRYRHPYLHQRHDRPAKGAPLTHRNWSLSALVWAAEFGIHPYTRWLLIMPMHTSGGSGLSIVSAISGSSLTVTDPNPEKVLHIIDQEKITFTQFSPTLLAKVIRHPAAKKTDFSHIEHWFTSAAPISAELLKEGTNTLVKNSFNSTVQPRPALWERFSGPRKSNWKGKNQKGLPPSAGPALATRQRS